MNSNQQAPIVGQQQIVFEGEWVYLNGFAHLIIKADDIGKARLVNSLERPADAPTEILPAQIPTKPARKRTVNPPQQGPIHQSPHLQPLPSASSPMPIQLQYNMPQGASPYQVLGSNKFVSPPVMSAPYSAPLPTMYNQANIPTIQPTWNVPPLGAHQKAIVLPHQWAPWSDAELPRGLRSDHEAARQTKFEHDSSRGMRSEHGASRPPRIEHETPRPPRSEHEAKQPSRIAPEAPRVKIKIRIPGSNAKGAVKPTTHMLPENATVTPHADDSSTDDVCVEVPPPSDAEEIAKSVPPRKHIKISLVCNRPSNSAEPTPSSVANNVPPIPAYVPTYTLTPTNTHVSNHVPTHQYSPNHLHFPTDANVPISAPIHSAQHNRVPKVSKCSSTASRQKAYGPPVSLIVPSSAATKVVTSYESNWNSVPRARDNVPSVSQYFGAGALDVSEQRIGQKNMSDATQRHSWRVPVTTDFGLQMQRIDVSKNMTMSIAVEESFNLPTAPVPISPLYAQPQMVTLLPAQVSDLLDDYKPLEEIDWNDLNSVPLTQGYWPLHMTTKVSLSPLSMLKRSYYERRVKRVELIGTTQLSRMSLFKGLKRTFSLSGESVDPSDLRETKRLKTNQQYAFAEPATALLDLTLSSQLSHKTETPVDSQRDRIIPKPSSERESFESTGHPAPESVKEPLIQSREEDESPSMLHSAGQSADVASPASEDMWSGDSANFYRPYSPYVAEVTSHEMPMEVPALKDEPRPSQQSSAEDELRAQQDRRPTPKPQSSESAYDESMPQQQSDAEDEPAPSPQPFESGDDEPIPQSELSELSPQRQEPKKEEYEAQSGLYNSQTFSGLASLLSKGAIDIEKNEGIVNKLAGFLEMEEKVKIKQEELKSLFDEYQKRHQEIEHLLQPLMGNRLLKPNDEKL